jgi:uncharacterized membrane protein YiaA
MALYGLVYFLDGLVYFLKGFWSCSIQLNGMGAQITLLYSIISQKASTVLSATTKRHIDNLQKVVSTEDPWAEKPIHL